MWKGSHTIINIIYVHNSNILEQEAWLYMSTIWLTTQSKQKAEHVHKRFQAQLSSDDCDPNHGANNEFDPD